MQLPISAQREAAEDIYFGQIVIIWARWIVILAAAVLALWSSEDAASLAKRAIVVVALMGVNFFLHGRSLIERPVNHRLLLTISMVDLAMVGLMVGFWGESGALSQLYVLYYPLIFGFALVFQPRLTAVHGSLAIASYLAICFAADPGFVADSSEAKAVVIRIIAMSATAALGTYYWRIQRDRRRSERGPLLERELSWR